MKKNTVRILAAALVVAICATVMASCGIIIPGEYRFGLATLETANGYIASAVILDASDRIALVRIDEVDFEYGNTTSKKAQGNEYGMTGKAPKGEWDEQVAYLERELVGKSIDELLGTSADDADIKAGCTISVNNFLVATARAMRDASEAEKFNSTVDHLAIALSFTAEKPMNSNDYVVSASAVALSRGYTVAQKSTFCSSDEQNYRFGIATLNTEKGQVAAAVIIDAFDRIALIRIDELDFQYGITDSKKTQGDDYGMLNSPYGGSTFAEWYVQIAHLEKKLVGKTTTALNSITGAEADIVAGCTIGVDSYTAAAILAVENAMSATSSFAAYKSSISLELTYTSVLSGTEYSITASASAKVDGTAAAGSTLNSTKSAN